MTDAPLKVADLAIALPARFQEDGKAPDPLALPPVGVSVPAMCERHVDQVDRDLSKPLGGLVLAPYMVIVVLLFQVATCDPELWRKAADIEELGIVLTRSGCPACRYPRGFNAAIRILRRRGLTFGAQLSRNEASSSNWRPDVFAVQRR